MLRIKVCCGIALVMLAILSMAAATQQPVQFKIGSIHWNTTDQEIVIPVDAAFNTATSSTDVNFSLLASIRINDATGTLVAQLPPWSAAFEIDPSVPDPTPLNQFVPLLPIRVTWDRLESAFVGEVTIIARVTLKTLDGVTISSQVHTEKGVLINPAEGS